jgi:putative ABC transport system permease protein
MLRVTLKGVRGHLLRFLLTAVAVMLGVSLVAGTYVLTDSIQKTFDELVDAGAAGLDAQVRGAEAGQSIDGVNVLRAPLPLTLADQLREVDGVRRVVPDYQGFALLVGKDGTAVRNGGAPSFGFAYFPDDPTLTTVSGRGPTNASEVALESSTLELSGLRVGDKARALIGGQPREVTIVGDMKFDAPTAGATIVMVDEQTARTVFAPDGTVQSFSVNAQSGVSDEELVRRLDTVLPSQAEAVTSEAFARETSEQIREGLGGISVFLLIFAAVALFVGGFIIANTFSMLVAQRTRELALLRAVGASRGQIMRVVLGEAVVLGLVGAGLGLGLGLVLAAGLQALFGSIGLEISGGLPVLPRTVIASLLVGVVVTLLSAVLPAVRAARIAPVTAMRDDIAMPVGGVVRRGIAGGVLLAGGGVLTWMIVNQDNVNWNLVGLGAALVLIGLVIAAPATTRPVVRIVAKPFTLITRVVGRLARENALRNPRRTATTAMALMVGLALVVTVSVMASSMRASVSDLVERQLTADFVLNGGGVAGFPPSVAQGVDQLPGVASVAPIGGINVEANDKNFYAIAATAQGIKDNVKVDVLSGSLDALDRDELVISKSTQEDTKWNVGTQVKGTVGSLKDQSFRVGAVIDDNQVLNSPGVVVSQALYDRAVPTGMQLDYLVYVKADPGSDLATLRASLTKLVDQYIVVSVQDGAEFTNAQADQINTILYIMYALLALTVIIAILGIINTMALAVFERTREIGLLRAVGLSRLKLGGMVTIESVATAVFGAVLGSVLGLAMGVVVQRGLVSEGLEELSIPWLTIVIVIIGAAVAGVVAAVLPAWRAVRLDVLRAITTE